MAPPAFGAPRLHRTAHMALPHGAATGGYSAAVSAEVPEHHAPLDDGAPRETATARAGPAGRSSAELAHALAVRRSLQVWLQPLAALASASVALLLFSWALDARPGSPGLLYLLTHFESERGQQALSDVGQVVTSILGVAISVVAIIVELASNRYTHRITELFFRTRVNFAVMGLFVLSGINSAWVALTWQHGHHPLRATLLSLVLMTVSLLLLLPYFAFVFDFVNPMNIVSRIRRETMSAVADAPASLTLARARAENVQQAASDGTEQLSDVALNAMANHDGAIAMASVNSLGELARDYLSVKSGLTLDWFQISDHVAHDPDFVSMSRDVLDQLARDRSWFEFKVLRQLQTVYQAALGSNREICYVVSIHTRELAERAMELHDRRVVELCVKFFNTYLRSTVNARDVRTAYNVFNQYRLLAEAALRGGEGRYAVEMGRYFKYYGQLAFHMDLGFVLETAAYDLSALNELAFDLRANERHELLRIFLQVDKEGEGASREASLRGVRKAQVRLATYYLLHGDEVAAREVFVDMRNEKPARLASIRDEMLSISSRDFWEVTDRGSNFDYIPPDRKRCLVEFFRWFGDTLAPPRVSLIPSGPPEMPHPAREIPSTPRSGASASAPPTPPSSATTTDPGVAPPR